MNTKSLQNEKFHTDNNAKMVPFAGYNMPMWYTSIADEHNCVRNNVGIFDVSHMGEFYVSGENSKSFLQKVTTNDINKLEKGKVQYSSILNRSGGIIDDLLVYDMGNNKYMLVVNASNMGKDFLWLNENNDSAVDIKNHSENVSLFAVQGPNAEKVCNKLFEKNLSEIKYYNFIEKETKEYGHVIISATGYTGAGGFELYVKNEYAESIWKDIISKGKEYEIQPIGLGAIDTLRLEMGFCLHGNDIDDSINPIEAGLGWICKKDIKFIGSDIVSRDRENKPSKILIGFILKDKGIPRKGYKILNSEGLIIGEVTSGSISPFTKKAIGMGYIDFNENKESKSIFIEVRGKKIEAIITKRPFI
jgi:aminomethyltransferase